MNQRILDIWRIFFIAIAATLHLPAHALFHSGFLFCLLPEEAEVPQNRSFQLYSLEVEIQLPEETESTNPLLGSNAGNNEGNTSNFLPGLNGNPIQTFEEISLGFDTVGEIEIEKFDEE